jgi:hypothetical protein
MMMGLAIETPTKRRSWQSRKFQWREARTPPWPYSAARARRRDGENPSPADQCELPHLLRCVVRRQGAGDA